MYAFLFTIALPYVESGFTVLQDYWWRQVRTYEEPQAVFSRGELKVTVSAEPLSEERQGIRWLYCPASFMSRSRCWLSSGCRVHDTWEYVYSSGLFGSIKTSYFVGVT